MARPLKKGLDYFPLDVGIFEDDKLFDVQNDYGPLGEIIYIRLLCLVYKNGYYYKFENLDKLAAMMIRSIGNRWAKDKKTVKEVILYLAKINLFSSELMLRNVITSRSIQERYLLAVERRQSKINEYNLLESSNLQEGLQSAPKIPVSVTETKINVTETIDNVSDNATKKSKVKKSKEDESSVVCDICRTTDTTHTAEEMTVSAILKLADKMGYNWDESEAIRFMAYNMDRGRSDGWASAMVKWERNRKNFVQLHTGKRKAVPMTEQEIEEMNEYLSLQSRLLDEVAL